ncbi:MAG TPA: hypothetical protein VFS29_10950 [Motilibacteraceae bacterium]|nr:hypothetical protein [Motilibacteraceae bacterium]
MAGGMRPTRGPSLAERTDAQRAQNGAVGAVGAAGVPDERAAARPWPRHCWFHPADGGPHLPGLLLEWRRTDDGAWLGRVAIGTLDPDGLARLVEQWVPARQLEPR